MSESNRNSASDSNPISNLFDDATGALGDISSIATDWADSAADTLQNLLEKTTETMGGWAEATRNNPLIQTVEKIPGINVLPKVLGDVDIEKIEQEVAELQQKHPTETPDELAHRIIVDTAIQAGTVGLITNIVPPLALALFAVDIAAITKLQSEMVYRIAGVYGLPLDRTARRGEVVAIFGLSFGGSGALKSGLSLIELVPGIGAVVGATSNASIIYVIGRVASLFYDAKSKGKTLTAEDIQRDGNAFREQVNTQQIVMDQILTHMAMVSYPGQAKSDLLPVLEKLSLASTPADLETLPPVEALLNRLEADFAKPLAIQCYKIALSTGEISSEERALLNQITDRFDLSPEACRAAAASSMPETSA